MVAFIILYGVRLEKFSVIGLILLLVLRVKMLSSLLIRFMLLVKR